MANASAWIIFGTFTLNSGHPETSTLQQCSLCCFLLISLVSELVSNQYSYKYFSIHLLVKLGDFFSISVIRCRWLIHNYVFFFIILHGCIFFRQLVHQSQEEEDHWNWPSPSLENRTQAFQEWLQGRWQTSPQKINLD